MSFSAFPVVVDRSPLEQETADVSSASLSHSLLAGELTNRGGSDQDHLCPSGAGGMCCLSGILLCVSCHKVTRGLLLILKLGFNKKKSPCCSIYVEVHAR